MKNQVILYYKFIKVENPEKEVKVQKAVCQKIGLTGRVLIGEEGINGTLEGNKEQIEKYRDYISKHPLFSDIVFKTTESEIKAFDKLKIKFRPEIVALNSQVDLTKTGKRISSQELHEILENKEEVVLVDMRNDYESNIGKFKNAIAVDTENFRDLPSKIDKLKNLKDKKVITYCTGGIRCEKASALLVENGFKNVYQLDGGIFTYAEKYPDGFFEGKCFVFDKRMSVSFETKRQTVLTNCEHCDVKSDRYLDCVDDICHRLFICCQECQSEKNGFCTRSHNISVEPTTVASLNSVF